VSDPEPLPRLFDEAGLAVLGPPLRPREGRAWRVEWRHEQGVLRQTSLAPDASAVDRSADDVGWLHGFLTTLAPTGFPAPRPLPAFAGRSWTISARSLWQLVTFVPGRVVGWSAVPSMAEIGVLMGQYHVAVGALEWTAERPGSLPLAHVPAILLSGQVEAAGVPDEQTASIRNLAAELAAELTEAGQRSAGRLIIHGDFTCHNVIAAGTPPVAAGVIDFELAHLDSPLADIGYGLWRSGRPHQDAVDLDTARVTQFLRGYTSVRPISAEQARLIPVYVRGRGLQMIAKRVRAGRPGTGMLDQVSWLSAHKNAVAEICVAVC
jgi:homoserine kinase type II